MQIRLFMDKKTSYDISIEFPLFNRIWRVIGYISCGLGMVSLMLTFVTILAVRSNPAVQLDPQLYPSVVLAAITPWIIGASIEFIIGAVGLYFGGNKQNNNKIQNKLPSYPTNETSYETNETNLLERLNRLEEVVDNNFNVISKRLDSIEKKQKLASQNTLIKAKKE
jgi:hypothetical protein